MDGWGERVLERLRGSLPAGLAAEPGVWVVGGAVRDALLGREPRELDLVVEGDAVALARGLGPLVAAHERFGTATVAGVDLASARTETYERPGALPAVRLGASMEEDLRRRDFSVNAMAVRLTDGAEAAWPGALDDLRAGVLRVLHERSFLDDPTRMIRLARYAARLGFRADPGTDALVAGAVAGGAVATVSGSRLGAELRLLLEEPQPEALVAVERHGLAAAVVAPEFEVVPAAVAAAGGGSAALGACLFEAAPADVAAALERLAFPAGERDVVMAAAGARARAEALLACSTPSEVAEVAERVPEAALRVSTAFGAAEPVERWLGEWRHMTLAISGDDLLAAGLSGPAIGTALRAARAAALDGRAPDRDSQLRIALAAAP